MSDVVSHGNRRAAYRVQPAADDELDLAMLGRRQRLVPGEVRDVAIGGARLRVERDAGGLIEDGEQVSVSINSKRHNYDGQLPARVVTTRRDGGVHIVHLSFLGDTQNLNDPPPGMRELFNRRATYRGIEPSTCAEFNALVTSIGKGAASMQSYPVAIRNISNTGVSIELDSVTHAALDGCARLKLSLELPGHVQPMAIACHVRHRSESGGSFVYGCEYDWSDTSDSLGVVEDLAAYILDSIAEERSARTVR